ncbi:MAG TPA: metallophosphoesterase [Blastocatellia bacterium]|nr:metallophosphoesterase [Blastocatellia bacterium]
MRIFAVSDLHTDFAENRRRLQQLSSIRYLQDVLVVAGDIADDLKIIAWTLRLLRSKFGKVVYVPGNHELWVRNTPHDSVEKFHQILSLCDEIGIFTRPARAGKAWIIPLFSWYDVGFDDDNTADVATLEGWADFYFCKWPDKIRSVSEYFLKINEPNIMAYNGPVITFSHFLPRRELLPPVSKLSFKGLPLVAGAPALDRQIRVLNSVIHVFGHSHINYDQVIDGVRYVHHAFGYPREEGSSEYHPKQIWGAGIQSDTDQGVVLPELRNE